MDNVYIYIYQFNLIYTVHHISGDIGDDWGWFGFSMGFPICLPHYTSNVANVSCKCRSTGELIPKFKLLEQECSLKKWQN